MIRAHMWLYVALPLVRQNQTFGSKKTTPKTWPQNINTINIITLNTLNFTILCILYLTSNLMQVIQVYTWLDVTHNNLRCLKPLNLFLEILRSGQWSDSSKAQPTTCMVCPNYSLFHISAHIHSRFHST